MTLPLHSTDSASCSSLAETHINTYTTARLLPIWVLVVDVEPLGRAQQLWKKTDMDKMTRGSKTGHCRHIWFYLFLFRALCQSLKPVCAFKMFLFPLHFSLSSLPLSNNVTSLTGWRAFLASRCLTLPHLTASLTPSQQPNDSTLQKCMICPHLHRHLITAL